MPVGKVYIESAESVNVQILTYVVDGVHGDNRDDILFVVTHLLGESLDGLEDNGLRQLIESDPVDFWNWVLDWKERGLRLILEELPLVSLRKS